MMPTITERKSLADKQRDVLDIESYMNEFGYPPALAKACVDPFDYAIGLRDGSIICFQSADALSPEWVHINGSDEVREDGFEGLNFIEDIDSPAAFKHGYLFSRGVDVRVSDIVWASDNPCG